MSTHARPVIATTLLACLGQAMVGACAFIPGEDSKVPAAEQTPRPAPRPALTLAEVKPVLARFGALSGASRRKLNPALVAPAFTGSSAQMESAKYRILKANRVPIRKSKYGQVFGASPMFTGHPKWFFAALTDTGYKPPIREIIVFVQERAGAPWRAAYTPIANKPARGPLARDVDVEDNPAVVPLRDPSLAMSPQELPGALSEIVNLGKRAPRYRDFEVPSWITTATKVMKTARSVFRGSGWTGTARYAPAKFPIYAVRTKSGGALVWSAIDYRATFRHTKPGSGITWTHESWGDLLRPFTGKSTVNKSLTSVERYEVLAYVPPTGKGRIRLLAKRWGTVQIQGR